MTTAARQYIDGELTESEMFEQAFNPATGKSLGEFSDGTAGDARAAVDAARGAFETTDWASNRQVRSRVLMNMADLLEARSDEFIRALSRDNGKTLEQARFELSVSVPKLRYYAAAALTETGHASETAPGLIQRSVAEPVGIAGVIVPWNSPIVLSIRSFAPALAAGCTVAMKLPPQTAMVNGLLHQLFADTSDLPRGVINSVTESGNHLAELLTTSPHVAAVSYTGSAKVGRTIMANSAPHLKKLSLELGGKTPMMIFSDADLDAAVPVLVQGITTFTGQFCMAGSRILVHESRAEELSKRLVAALDAVTVGAGDENGVDMGPMIDAANASRVDRTVQTAIDNGSATALRRGGQQGDTAFYSPSLLAVADVGAGIVQEEVFGPVATFETFSSDDEAVSKANATEYGLAASIWTRDVDRPSRVGRRIKAGTIWTNTWAVVTDSFEEGGFKQSGLGRLNGLGALAEFQEIKTYTQQL
ncbi:aldehyde dehydrogenase family protein [Rothia uropygialis]|uniref:aldehyde dehydrogenase family protein n=1 Tax=Kocuria sp. 36 TaxID=1415402 RepID=UPI00101B7AC4|nr:aldehyde dehydrogenase family protein [Kocuria sp. 36]